MSRSIDRLCNPGNVFSSPAFLQPSELRLLSSSFALQPSTKSCLAANGTERQNAANKD
jgi:hypothetical protein